MIVITSRADNIKEKTERWLDRFFPDSFSEIIFSNNIHRSNGKSKKSQICHLMKIDIMIEDCLDYAIDCANYSKVVLFDRPWNAVEDDAKLSSNIHRVYDWQEVLEVIDKLEEK